MTLMDKIVTWMGRTALAVVAALVVVALAMASYDYYNEGRHLLAVYHAIIAMIAAGGFSLALREEFRP